MRHASSENLIPSGNISTIYIGGGTPTLLTGDQVISISKEIRKNFNVDKNCEFTIEANPGTVDKEKLRLIKKSGINRISIGAQSFDDDELKLLGRIHDEDEIVKAFNMARDTGFNNINLDLIFALPGQSLKSWKNSLEKAVDLKPEHISTYNLEIEKGTPLFKKLGSQFKADNDLEYNMYKETISFLKESGYIHYEISNFCKPGSECRHNINYWKNGDYIGLGAAAASHINGERFQNTKDLLTYIKDPIGQKAKELRTAKDEMGETVFMGLRMIEGINVRAFEQRFGLKLDDTYKDEIKELTDLGLIEIKNNRLRLTDKGLYMANEVFERLI